jgi:subtilisin family serine protease
MLGLVMAFSLVLGLLGGVVIALSAPAQGAEVPPSLLAKARERGTVRVIVGLDVDFQAEGVLPSLQAAREQRQSIARVQSAVVHKLANAHATVVARFKTIPFMAFEVDADGLLALAALPEITDFEEDLPVPPDLASATAVIGADVAWAQGYTGVDQTVAILDTGVDKTHPFFSTGGDKVVSEACYSTNSPSYRATSLCPGGVEASTAPGSGVNCDTTIARCDHGTHVAGIAAGDDGSGPNFGVARGATVIAVQVFSRFDDDEEGPVRYCGLSGMPSPCALTYYADQIKGLERVYELHTDFNIAAVNMSLGGGRYFDTATCDSEHASRKAAIDNLRSVGIATIASSGNSGYRDSMGAPACISTAISVGATDDDDDVAWFSNVASFLDLLAPGVNIVSSVPGTGVTSKHGTSMAAPMVTGAWAVARAVSPSETITDILTLFRDTGTSVNDNQARGFVTDMRRINLDVAMDILANKVYMPVILRNP